MKEKSANRFNAKRQDPNWIESEKQRRNKKRQENLSRYREKARMRYEKNKEKIKNKQMQVEKEKRKLNLVYRELSNRRKDFQKFLIGDNKPTFQNILGCSLVVFQEHIESLWKEGMTWQNYGRSSSKIPTWQIDHIIPLSSASTVEELLNLFHYSNTQPLWAEENTLKGNKTP
jgi:hypothetical protein